ncbi:GNAT family N-acetyltransferase [Pedobacter sp. MC2016-24]|uniref:GNAT family N-acetyltransferase n=1 Tax=Pedobacter sp. MC2016-24 TaxID=2780090 RepID=UPI001881BEA5|nr:GNAT family N-acetyltransferase [Pedobacter sp. MC2016-24]MBE9601482.1 GNAT family N-acetyltransferase [Pedobacter sp. MC2016-24]
MPLEINFAKPKDLDLIIHLWGLNRSTLGLMPKDAFIDHIKKGWILVAHKDSNLIGYLQFRHTARTQTLSIVHLCVDQANRGQKVAERLIDHLTNKFHSKSRGIKLNCRSDYAEANKFWAKYGFQPKGQLPSRGTNPAIHLVVWWYNFGRQDLFSIQHNDKTKAVIDFNIIAKMMHIEITDSAKEEIAQLQSDWLVTEVEYYHTSETVNEIHRDGDPKRRIQSRTFIKNYPELNVDKFSVKAVELELLEILPGLTDNAISDRRQLAETIISGFPYFVTLDEGILKQGLKIRHKYQLKVVRPSTLITEIDMSVNAADYNPSKLSGNSFFVSKLTAMEKSLLPELFLDNGKGEKKSTFNELIQELIVRPTASIKIVKENDSIVAAFGYDLYEDTLGVPLLRTKQYPLRKTLFIQNVTDLIKEAISHKKHFIIISDPYLTDLEQQFLLSHGFFNTTNGFIRGTCDGIYQTKDLKFSLSSITSRISEISALVDAVSDTETAQHLYALQLEKVLWPMKVADANIPCFIIPIKPNFAKQLFDTNTAKTELFGVTPQLIWSKENVYYRHVAPNVEDAPARILWYASADPKSPRQKAIVASSFLNEINIGPAKELYRKHQKFGIYEWSRDIAKLVKGDAFQKIKALRFSDSESFSNTISLRKVKSILSKHAESDNNFQSPLRIKNATFMEIYKLGTGGTL